MADYTAYFSGEWVPFSQVKIDPMDRGFMVGDVIFDVARTFGGKSFRIKEHIDRLYRSLKFVRIDPGLSPEEMLDISEETIRRNEPLRSEVGDYTITQFVTRGPGGSARDAGPPTVCVKAAPVNFARFAQLFGDSHFFRSAKDDACLLLTVSQADIVDSDFLREMQALPHLRFVVPRANKPLICFPRSTHRFRFLFVFVVKFVAVGNVP